EAVERVQESCGLRRTAMREKPASRDLPATTLGRSKDPAEQLWRLWCQGQRPDVDTFVARVGPLAAEQLAAVLRVDQRERWQAVPVEVYLQRPPLLWQHPEPLLDLIHNEFLLREQQGEQPTLGEYRQRFPEQGEILQAQIELHRALAFELSSTRSGEVMATPPR